MSYEQGVQYGIRWMLGQDEFDPMDGGGNEKAVLVGPFDGKLGIRQMNNRENSETVLNTGLTSQIGLANWTLARLADFGVRIPPENRLIRALRLLSDVNAGRRNIRDGGEVLRIAVAEAQWAIVQMYIITRAMSSRPGPIDHLRKVKLRRMLGGHDVEDQERNPIARNTQFELYVAAMLATGGAQVCLAEPDIRIIDGDSEIGVAVKRLSSNQSSAFIDRVREGERQVQRNCGHGFVAVNIDSIVRRREGVSGDAEAYQEQFDRFLTIVGNLNGHLELSDSLLGVVYFGSTFEWFLERERPLFRIYNFHSFQLVADESGKQAQWHSFFDDIFHTIEERLQRLQR